MLIILTQLPRDARPAAKYRLVAGLNGGRSRGTIQMVPPEFGHDLAGNVFFSYGNAITVWIR